MTRLAGRSMMHVDDSDFCDDAADTLRFDFSFDFESPTDPDATSIYDLTPTPVRHMGRSQARRRQLRDTRENVLRLREALAAGWDIEPELVFEERQLAALETDR